MLVNDSLTNYPKTIVKVPCTVKKWHKQGVLVCCTPLTYESPEGRILYVISKTKVNQLFLHFGQINYDLFGLDVAPYPSQCIVASRMLLINWRPSFSDHSRRCSRTSRNTSRDARGRTRSFLRSSMTFDLGWELSKSIHSVYSDNQGGERKCHSDCHATKNLFISYFMLTEENLTRKWFAHRSLFAFVLVLNSGSYELKQIFE